MTLVLRELRELLEQHPEWIKYRPSLKRYVCEADWNWYRPEDKFAAIRDYGIHDMNVLCECILSNEGDLPLTWFHNEMIDLFMMLLRSERWNEGLILIPRGHLKTTILTIGGTIWTILNNPNVSILINSAALRLMKWVMKAVKWHFMSNEFFRLCYPDFCPEDGKRKWCTGEDFTIPNRTKNVKEPTCMIGSEGSPRTGFHYDHIFNDDLHNEDNTRTPDLVHKVIEGWEKQGPLFKVPRALTKRIQIGTVWDFDDINMHVMRMLAPAFFDDYKKEDYEHPKDIMEDKYPEDSAKVYILSCYTDDFKITEDRQSLWPEAWSLKQLEHYRTKECVSDDFFNMQMRNMVITDTTRSFRREWFKYFKQEIDYPQLGIQKKTFIVPYDKETEIIIPEEELIMRLTLDPAFRVKAHNDFSGFVIAGHWYDYENGRRIILIFDAFAEKLETHDLIRRIDDECGKWGIKEIGIEEHGLQFLFTDQLVDKTRHSWIGVNHINITKINRGSEVIVGKSRVLRLMPFYERSQIFHAEFMREGELETQLMNFTGKHFRGKHDDIADAMSDQIDFPVGGGALPYDNGNPRFRERSRESNRYADIHRDPWERMEDKMAGVAGKDDWKRR